jgi:hypothetical protein
VPGLSPQNTLICTSKNAVTGTVTDVLRSTTVRLYSSAAAPVDRARPAASVPKHKVQKVCPDRNALSAWHAGLPELISKPPFD